MLETGGRENSFPDQLFRYRPPTDHLIEEIEKALFDNSIFVSNCQNINDPFDFMPSLENSPISEINAYIKSHKIKLTTRNTISEHSGKPVSRAEYQHKTRLLKKPLERARHEMEIARKIWRDARKSGGMACFSESMSSLPMWAHYAGNHTGVCLSFKWSLIDDINDEIDVPMKVDYVEKRPRVSTIDLLATSSRGIFDNADEALTLAYMKKMYLTKGKDWEYEREWRAFTSNGTTSGYRRIPSLVLSRIILGYRMLHELRNKIATRFSRHIEIYQAVPCSRDYAIKIKPIEN